LDDRLLHERVMDRDACALATLYALSSSAIFATALRVTRHRDAAEDITQAVFLDLWMRPERYEPDRGPLRSWLAIVARHAGLDWLRQEANRSKRELRFAQVPVAFVPDVEDVVDARLVSKRVRLALDALPDVQSTPIRLAFFRGKSYQQVAKELRVPEGTIKSRIRTGLRGLGDAVGAEAVDQPQTRAKRALTA
jgi:RNA polymerase sigma factor (sigma-70 family)